jgi:hypothetical protein
MSARLRSIALLLALAGCARHPTITASVAGGTIGFGACFIEVEKASTCSIVGASTALFLGGLVALATYFTDSSAHELKLDDETEELPEIVRELPDAGIDAPAAPHAPDAAVATVADATTAD